MTDDTWKSYSSPRRWRKRAKTCTLVYCVVRIRHTYYYTSRKNIDALPRGRPRFVYQYRTFGTRARVDFLPPQYHFHYPTVVPTPVWHVERESMLDHETATKKGTYPNKWRISLLLIFLCRTIAGRYVKAVRKKNGTINFRSTVHRYTVEIPTNTIGLHFNSQKHLYGNIFI